MNQKKAKALRRLLRDEMPMTTLRPLAVYRLERDPITHRNVWKKVGVEGHKRPVNHYRNAKALYKGSLEAAVKASRRHAHIMVSLGVYKVA